MVVIYNRSISLLKKYIKSNRFVSFTTLLKSDEEIVTKVLKLAIRAIFVYILYTGISINQRN